MRGYGRWRLGPLSVSNEPLGGLSMFEGSVELRHPIYKKLAGAAFVDFGQTTIETYQVPDAASFRLRPGGDVSNADRSAAARSRIPSQAPRGDPWWQIYFSIGNFF